MTPTEVADRWVAGLRGAGEKVRAGVQAVTESPMAAAARQTDKYLTGVQEAVSSGRLARGLARVSLEEWKRLMIEKGIARLGQGATAARGKFLAFFQDFQPFLNSVTSRTRSMPSTTFEDRIARMVSQAQGVHEYKRS